MNQLEISAEALTDADNQDLMNSGKDAFRKCKARLWILLGAHVGLVLALSTLSAYAGRPPQFELLFLLAYLVLAVISAQACLLGFWAAFSPVAWWSRLLPLIAGIVWLEFVMHLGLSGDGKLLPTMVILGCTVAFVLIRLCFVQLRRFPLGAAPTYGRGQQFSVRALLLITLAVALAVVVVGRLREHVPESPRLFPVAIVSSCLVMIGLLSVWAALELAPPKVRSGFVLVIAGVTGTLVVYILAPGLMEWRIYVFYASALILQAAVLISTLLVVRSCGYRLVRKSEAEAWLPQLRPPRSRSDLFRRNQ